MGGKGSDFISIHVQYMQNYLVGLKHKSWILCLESMVMNGGSQVLQFNILQLNSAVVDKSLALQSRVPRFDPQLYQSVR